MNEHDSERMKGMLESLGYREAESRTRPTSSCSTHTRFARRRTIACSGTWGGQAAQGRGSRAGGRDRRLLVAVAQGRGLRALPVRRRGVRAGQIHRLAEFLSSDSLTAQGYFEFEGFPGHLPARREREHQAWVQISVGMHLGVLYGIVPSTAAARSLVRPRSWWPRSSGSRRTASEVTLLGQNVCSYGRDLPEGGEDDLRGAARAGRRRRRASSGSATRARIPRTSARTSSTPTPS